MKVKYLFFIIASLVLLVSCTVKEDKEKEEPNPQTSEIGTEKPNKEDKPSEEEKPSENDEKEVKIEQKEMFDNDMNNTIFQMNEMIKYIKENNLTKARHSFWLGHDFYHAYDPILKIKEPEKAKTLWDTVTNIEKELDKKDEEINKEQLTKYAEEAIKILNDTKNIW